MGAIFRREVRSYFTSPIGYIFLAAFYAYSGVMFANYSLESGYTRLDSVFSALLIIIIVLIPVLTNKNRPVSAHRPCGSWQHSRW